MEPLHILWLVPLMFTGTAAQARTCDTTPGRHAEQISGEITKGESYRATTSSGWIVKLLPVESGWVLQVSTKGRDAEDLSRFTPPWHSAPNPRYIEGWHFRNAANTGPNDGTVNAPGELREFIFSPDVGNRITRATQEAVEQIRSFGRGWVLVESYVLTPPRARERAAFESLKFTVCVTWPAV